MGSCWRNLSCYSIFFFLGIGAEIQAVNAQQENFSKTFSSFREIKAMKLNGMGIEEKKFAAGQKGDVFSFTIHNKELRKFLEGASTEIEDALDIFGGNVANRKQVHQKTVWLQNYPEIFACFNNFVEDFMAAIFNDKEIDLPGKTESHSFMTISDSETDNEPNWHVDAKEPLTTIMIGFGDMSHPTLFQRERKSQPAIAITPTKDPEKISVIIFNSKNRHTVSRQVSKEGRRVYFVFKRKFSGGHPSVEDLRETCTKDLLGTLQDGWFRENCARCLNRESSVERLRFQYWQKIITLYEALRKEEEILKKIHGVNLHRESLETPEILLLRQKISFLRQIKKGIRRPIEKEKLQELQRNLVSTEWKGIAHSLENFLQQVDAIKRAYDF